MSDHQVSLLTAAISTAGPMVAVLIGILLNNRQLASLRAEMLSEIASVRAEIASFRREVTAQFEAAHQGLLRVEGIVDARLKHLEERAK